MKQVYYETAFPQFMLISTKVTLTAVVQLSICPNAPNS